MTMRGPGRMDITSSSWIGLLSMATGTPESRIPTSGTLPDSLYNLHVEAPGADPKQLNPAIEFAIATGAHLHVEHHIGTRDAHILTAAPDAQSHFAKPGHSLGAFYNPKTQTMQCSSANPNRIARAVKLIVDSRKLLADR
jgi:hypothetical protein